MGMAAPLDINRLAKGLAREETRQLVKVNSAELVNRLGDFMAGKFKLPFMQTMGLREPQVVKARKQLIDFLEANYQRFDHVDHALRKTKKRSLTGIKTVETACYWAPLEMGYERKDGDKVDIEGAGEIFGFKEKVLLLFFQRTAVSKMLATVDEIYQRVTVSDHALYRMIDRGLVDEKPLKRLSDDLAMWLPWVNALNLLDIKGGFIPMERGGLCLQSFAMLENTNDPNWELHDRRRFAVLRSGLYVNHLNTPDLAARAHPEGLRAWTEYRISTYLSHDQLRSERLWAYDAMLEFHMKYGDEMAMLFHLNMDLDMDKACCEFLANEFTDFRMDLKKLLTNPRYTAAAKTVSLS